MSASRRRLALRILELEARLDLDPDAVVQVAWRIKASALLELRLKLKASGYDGRHKGETETSLINRIIDLGLEAENG